MSGEVPTPSKPEEMAHRDICLQVVGQDGCMGIKKKGRGQSWRPEREDVQTAGLA